MNRLSLSCIGLVLLICDVSQGESNKRSVLEFGDHLHVEGDYYRAITEYKRFMFLDQEDEYRDAIRHRIAMSYFKGGKYEMAMRIFRDISWQGEDEALVKKSKTMLAACYYETSDYAMAVSALQDIARGDHDGLELRIGWCHLLDGNPKEAIDVLSKIGETSKPNAESSNLIQQAKRYSELPEKSPMIAGTLSAFLPGAGQAYNQRYRDALTSFILNGIFFWGTIEAFDNDENVAGAFAALISSGWYTGNIYNAASGSHKVNRERRKEFLYNMKVTCGISIADEKDMRFIPVLGARTTF